MIATTESASTNGVKSAEASGSIGRENRTNPYPPIFNSTLARITLPAVGASTCASGSHVWNGNIGTLIANARKNATNIQNWNAAGYGWATRSGIGNVWPPAQ